MVTYSLCFLTGVLLVQWLPTLPDVKLLLLLAFAAAILAGLRYWHGLWLIVGVIGSIIYAAHQLSNQLSTELEGKEMLVTGRVISLPEHDEKRVHFEFAITNSEQKLPSKISLNWYYPDQIIKAGEHWRFAVKLKRNHGNLNPGSFDFEQWMLTKGIGATGYVRVTPKPMQLTDQNILDLIPIWRQKIADRLSDTISDKANLAMIKALTIGDDSDISRYQWEVFRKTGTTHLIVISGSHIGLVAGLFYLIILKFWAWTGCLRWSPQRIAAAVAILMAVFYAALAGFSIPTQRSVIMLFVIMMAIIMQRNVRSSNTMAIALFVVLIFDPLAVLSIGFWLSFLAVCVILYVTSGRLGRAHMLKEALTIHWATSLALSPLLLLFFQQISLMAPLANFIAVPVVSILIVPAALLAVIMLFVWPMIAGKLFSLLLIVTQGLWWLLQYLAELPWASINHAMPSNWVLVFAMPGALLLLAPLGMPGRWLSLVMFLPLLFSKSERPISGNVYLTMLDVGQGLAVVVQTQEHTMIFDTGAKFSNQSDAGQNILLPFLRLHNINQIDKLIVSHGDNDHIGGAYSILRELPVKQVLTSVPQQLQAYNPVNCQAGQKWQWDGVSFIMLSPLQPFVSENDNSCVLKIQSKHGAILLTGDIEESAEAWLTQTYHEALKAEILLAPHHGSKTSSTAAFLKMVQPDFVLISAGYRNPFGHPHQEVLQRYHQAGVTWFNTVDSGAITVYSHDGPLVIKRMRDTERRYWRY